MAAAASVSSAQGRRTRSCSWRGASGCPRALQTASTCTRPKSVAACGPRKLALAPCGASRRRRPARRARSTPAAPAVPAARGSAAARGPRCSGRRPSPGGGACSDEAETTRGRRDRRRHHRLRRSRLTADPTPLPTLRLQPGRHKRVRFGHPWVFSNEVVMDAAAKALPAGGLVRLEAAQGEFLGQATFNPHTLIAARVLTVEAAAAIDVEFFAARLSRALALRERLYPGGFYRLVHAEADGLPGLIIDRFGDTLTIQLNTAGMERLRAPLLEALDRLMAPATIVLRNDTPARGLEGLPPAVETLRGAPATPLPIDENGLRYFADLGGGQKTGWYYDQRENRALVAGLAAGARVLDAYCYAGGFGLAAAVRGATAVTLLDRSEPALALAAQAATANGVGDRCRFERAEVFEALEAMDAAGTRFDIVVADPPAFVKSRKDLGAGVRGYRKLARLAARLVTPGGFLFIASCSHHVEPAMFAEQVAHGLDDTGRAARILRSVGAGCDHPVHPHLPESAYLKGQLLQLD
ncbi:MAG: class I SAM-dependent rRNA methyltransferase [Alphaproteobacteria bacterium]|nr:class I SAM-dependent rRNA methyltransferase [Alphaproteobacteria bacterium]